MICAIPDVVVVWAIRVQVLSLPNTLARTEQLLGTTDGEKKERKEKGKIFQELRFSFFLVLLLLLEQTTKRPVGALSESRNDENYNMYTIADVYGTVKGGPVGDPKGREPIMNGPNGDILNNSNETRRRRRRKKESTVRIWGASLVRSILLENSRKQPKVRNLEKAQTTFPLSLSFFLLLSHSPVHYALLFCLASPPFIADGLFLIQLCWLTVFWGQKKLHFGINRETFTYSIVPHLKSHFEKDDSFVLVLHCSIFEWVID